MVLKYISLFSGIGGFELAIENLHPRAKCLFFSEIDPSAIRVYTKHFPGHRNAGDVRQISANTLRAAVDAAGGCDLIVAGFPCNDLTSISPLMEGLDGAHSGLFYEMLRIIKTVRSMNTRLQIVVENNASMASRWKDVITAELSSAMGCRVFPSMVDSTTIGVQARKRLFWTTCDIPEFVGVRQTWSDVLEPVNSEAITSDAYHHVELAKRRNGLVDKKSVNSVSFEAVIVRGDKYRFVVRPRADKDTRWVKYPHHSDTALETSRTIHTAANDSVLLDRRGCAQGTFRIRRFTVKELARLFTFPDHYVLGTVNAAYVLYGKAVIVRVVEHVLKHALRRTRSNCGT